MTDKPDHQGRGRKIGHSDQARNAAHDEQLRQHREDLLDDALKETFPASDPTSIAQPEIRRPRPRVPK
jgi:hypothetical protein